MGSVGLVGLGLGLLAGTSPPDSSVLPPGAGLSGLQPLGHLVLPPLGLPPLESGLSSPSSPFSGVSGLSVGSGVSGVTFGSGFSFLGGGFVVLPDLQSLIRVLTLESSSAAAPASLSLVSSFFYVLPSPTLGAASLVGALGAAGAAGALGAAVAAGAAGVAIGKPSSFLAAMIFA